MELDVGLEACKLGLGMVWEGWDSGGGDEVGSLYRDV